MISFKDLPVFTFLGDSAATLKDMGIYVQNSAASTWTLPTIASSQYYKTPKFYVCKNMGTNVVTINTAGGEFFNEWGVATLTSITLGPGQGNIIYNDGTYWHLLFPTENVITPTITSNNYTVLAAYQVVLLSAVLAANATLTLPAATNYKGEQIRIWNTNTTAFTWTFAGGTVKDSTGTTTTVVSSGWITLVSDATNWNISATSTTGARIGTATLVAGTIAVSIAGITSSSKAFATRTVAAGTTLTTGITAVCTAGTLTITADVAAGTINTADTSTYNYQVIG